MSVCAVRALRSARAVRSRRVVSSADFATLSVASSSEYLVRPASEAVEGRSQRKVAPRAERPSNSLAVRGRVANVAALGVGAGCHLGWNRGRTLPVLCQDDHCCCGPRSVSVLQRVEAKPRIALGASAGAGACACGHWLTGNHVAEDRSLATPGATLSRGYHCWPALPHSLGKSVLGVSAARKLLCAFICVASAVASREASASSTPNHRLPSISAVPAVCGRADISKLPAVFPVLRTTAAAAVLGRSRWYVR